LKELRARARELAVNAAREKAEIYAAAAKVTVGQVLHIQDINPTLLQQESHMTAARAAVLQELAASEPEEDSLDPSPIQVGAAVVVAFAIVHPEAAKKLASLGGTMPDLQKTSQWAETK